MRAGVIFLVLVAATAVAVFVLISPGETVVLATPSSPEPPAAAPEPTVVPAAPIAMADAAVAFDVGPLQVSTSTARGKELLQQAQAALSAKELLQARTLYNEALQSGLAGPDESAARAALKQLFERTLLSLTVLPGDPYAELITVQAGDTLLKLGRKYKIPEQLIQHINRIDNPSRIRVGQSLKVIKGPFSAIVTKRNFQLDLFLGENYALWVDGYVVALGTDDSTPTGLWQIGDKIPNPKFWGARDLPPMEADDPKNPLGEHWLQLRGIAGEAASEMGYGIHGTIEPDKIGQRVSLGCIRLRNEDVANIFLMLYPVHSKVLVRP